MHPQFKAVNTDRSPVHLHNIRLTPSLTKEGAHDITFTHSSTLSCLSQLDYSYNPTLSSNQEDLTISDILKTNTTYTRVNVKAKIIQQKSQSHNFVRDRTFLTNITYVIADKTTSIDLTVWGEEDITTGGWYFITNVSVRKFQGATFLSSTRDSKFTKITCHESVCQVEHTTSQNLTADIIGTQVNVLYICPLKHPIPDMPLSTYKVHCEKCNTFYISSCITNYTHGTLKIKTPTEIKNVQIENKFIKSIINVPDTANIDTIIDTLLELPPVRMTLHQNNITHIETIKPHTKQLDIPNIIITPSPTESSTTLFPSHEDIEQFMVDFPENTLSPSTSTSATTPTTTTSTIPSSIIQPTKDPQSAIMTSHFKK
ncbi:uncharacterized protein LOC143747410 [Siphateles boraxobius]|uniref:uncharacterized protein LOC143747410 n=1 Tax=Siphateles boraxobius TaxID=180520 RepID=UPI00406406F5